MNAQLASVLIGFSVGLALVLLLRRSLRRLSGPAFAYSAWLLPPVIGLATLLPRMHWTSSMTSIVPGAMHAAMTASAANIPATRTWSLLLPLWAVIAALLLTRLVWRYARLHADMQTFSDTRLVALKRTLAALPTQHMRNHDRGPAVVAGLPSRIVLPMDFDTRFNVEQQRLVLIHELTHLRQGDAWWNLLFELLCAALWFHPLVWFARSRFRLDQELACDASVLKQHPHARKGYAHALFQGIDRPAVPVLAAWFDEPQLKERLHMIRNFTHRKTYRRSGVLVLASLMLGGVFAAQAMQPAVQTQAKADTKTEARFTSKPPPAYPASAIKKHLTGTVVMKVKVGTDGGVKKVVPLPGKLAPVLVQSATEAARKWHFTPARNAEGQPVVSWVRIPVTFNIPKAHKSSKDLPKSPQAT